MEPPTSSVISYMLGMKHIFYPLILRVDRSFGFRFSAFWWKGVALLRSKGVDAPIGLCLVLVIKWNQISKPPFGRIQGQLPNFFVFVS